MFLLFKELHFNLNCVLQIIKKHSHHAGKDRDVMLVCEFNSTKKILQSFDNTQ